ncbi:uncharacterized protein [Prorops nasuta]|uniref:uncharacterized protein n=1 Tax=Prorops nasuta TaxID=863751 RepID=UPI0034CE9D6C
MTLEMAQSYLVLLIQWIILSNLFTSFFVRSEYITRGTEEEKICNPQGKKHTIELNDSRPVNVKPKRLFNFNPNKNCNFVIKLKKGNGLMAVIQTLSFRRNGSQCLDYVQFKRGKQAASERICDPISTDKIKAQIDLSQEYAISSIPKGEIETYIFVSKEPLKPGETLNVSIVYTPLKDCKTESTSKYILGKGRTMCIADELFCDGFVNCDPNYCRDEVNCEDVVTSDSIGTKVTVGAVTTIFLCLIVFIMGMWICRKHKKLCWSSDCAGPSASSERSDTTREVPALASAPIATAPMLEVALTPTGHDKDLPPSYDSLFPEQTNPATS